LYRVLLRLLPREFRDRFGADMQQVFAARLREADSAGGRVRVWVHGAGDVLLHGLAERRARRHERPTERSTYVDSLLQDLRLGVRSLLRSPGFALAALITLALGLGATTAVFSVVNALLLRPLPYAAPERLVAVWPEANFNKTMVARVASGVPALESLSGISIWTMTVTGDGGEPAEVEVALVSASHFDVLGVAAARGRTFAPEEGARGRAGVVVLTHDFWMTRYGGDASVLGRSIRLAGADYDERTVIGIMAEGFRPVVNRDLAGWVVLEEPEATTFAGDNTWYVNWRVGRLAAGATLEQATAQLRVVAGSLYADDPGMITEEDVRLASIDPLRDNLVGPLGDTLWLLLGAVALVLLIACANVANLLLARGEHRLRELALRRALGARRGRVARQLLTEAAVLGLAGGGAGVMLAYGLLRIIALGAPPELPHASAITIDARVLLFAFAAALLAALAFGAAPVLRARGAAAADALRQGTRSAAGVRIRPGISSGLVALEIALAVLLVIGSGLMLRTLQQLHHVHPGLDARGVLVLRPAPPDWRYPDAAAMTRFYADVLTRIRALPGVESAAGIQLLPVTPGNWSFPAFPEGHHVPDGGAAPSINFRVVTPGWFETLRIPLLRGRSLEPADRADAPRVAVINRTMAEQFWPGQNPIGRTVRSFSPTASPYTIVGVVGDVHQRALDQPPRPEWYVPQEQLAWEASLFLAVRFRDPDNVIRHAAAIRDAVWSVDRDAPVSGIESLDNVIGRSAATTRFLTFLLVFFAALALTLGAVGVFGVTAWTVARRAPEFGVRLALGASRRHVLATAVLRGITPIAIGLGAGLSAAILATRLLESLLFGVRPADPLTFIAVALLLALVATAALVAPAWRATRIDPLAVLRSD